MTSLAEAYEGHVGEVDGLRRLYLGTGLFLAGAALTVLGIVAATTDLLGIFGLNTWQSWEVAGLAAGLGVPAVFVGVFIVLPASPRERAAAAIGSGVAVFGVMLFFHAFPNQWHGDPTNLTLPVVAVYFLGIVAAFWGLFTAIVNFKTRNNPGGTVSLNVETKGEVRTIEVPAERPSGGFGGVGVMGDIVGETEELGRPGTGSTVSDGGSSGDAISSPLDRTEAPARPRGPDRVGASQDRYCGSCAHFDYVRTDRGIQPYCGLNGRTMEDMDACEDWRANNER